MKRLSPLLACLALAMAACTDGAPEPMEPDVETAVATAVIPADQLPDQIPVLPSIELPPVFQPIPVQRALNGASGMTPAELIATLEPGETVTETKTVDLPEAPPQGDVLFAFDLTGSMGGELNNLKVNSVNIMNAVAGVISDVQFGLISHEDYPFFLDSTPFGCGYAATYGSAGFGDLAYRLDQTMTATTASVASAISAMVLKSGADGPESYSRALFESVAELTAAGADPGFGPIGWRTGAKKIVVAFNDNVPHDCAFDAVIGGTGDTGIDPGRDNAAGTSDDLQILPVLNTMAAQNVSLINIHSGGSNTLWGAYAALTGGTNFPINFDGTFPGGTDPATEIANLIQAEVSMIDELTLDVCAGDEAFSDWIVSAESATDLTLPTTVELDLEVGPPASTPDGTYHFQICAFGDGAEFGRQDVWITVPVPVLVDIKPWSDPNSIRLGHPGLIPIAILTTESFDASMVDPSTVTMGNDDGSDTPVALRQNGVLQAALEDVDYDGDLDLVLKFSQPDLEANGDLDAFSTELTVNGLLYDGTPFVGRDAVRVIT